MDRQIGRCTYLLMMGWWVDGWHMGGWVDKYMKTRWVDEQMKGLTDERTDLRETRLDTGTEHDLSLRRSPQQGGY